MCARLLRGGIARAVPRGHLRPYTTTTRVDVANIRLTRPQPPKSARWVGLEGLDARSTGSLIPDTLKTMDADPPPIENKIRHRRALDHLGVPDFREFAAGRGVTVDRVAPKILQLNVGLYCNQACSHCHVDSSPRRTETMSREVAGACLDLLGRCPSVRTLDLTGGAPELHEQFRYLVQEATAMGRQVIDRCNLTVLQEPGQEDLAEFLAANRVRVVASLPCYGPKNVNMQRGSGVFDRSIRGLLKLNERGYGVEGSGLVLDLVYNPLGAFLSPPQAALATKYKEELFDTFGVVFNGLLTITNMPIKRFADFLHRRGELAEYMALLVSSFNPSAAEGLMCRDTISVRWDGRLYDCDFNQQLDLGMGAPDAAAAAGSSTPACQADGGRSLTVFDLRGLDDVVSIPIALGRHCYGCTAGQGSGCQGATVP
jgi:radical SAM/Cys-rich protein